MTADEIKSTYSMREIVERYGFHPNRAGFISCPFHQGDKTPSLKIYEKDYHCHACGANGDIFTFVQEIEGISFKEAFRSLGGTYQPCCRIASQRRRNQIKREREEQYEAERKRTAWKWRRLGEVCWLLRLPDKRFGLLQCCIPYRHNVLDTGGADNVRMPGDHFRTGDCDV